MLSSLRKTPGFTLIELLIVVAIIGILAAIAVPNFLNAQIKAKVARAQSDLRSMATAIEMYTLDNNAPPPSTNPSMTNSDTTYGYMRFNLTTPVAYLSSGLLPDPFVDQWDEETQRNDELYYTYHNLKMLTDHILFPDYMEDFYGTWRALSYGPDKTYANGTYGVRIYDTTNGVLSFGNIIISQKYQTVKDIPAALK
ncbi:MAG: prepilin-type N-terminal cleavage/methylation domain-containing protein [Candidatus Hinthialibacter antarcticus]|nr:prepilin-type N-terminal cleavage/methylation domain-containing protein [Candidatus Hinthialibacter antarcticus]